MSDSIISLRPSNWAQRPQIIRALAAVARHTPQKTVVRVSAQIARFVRYPAAVFPMQDRVAVLSDLIPQSAAYQNAVNYLESVLEGK